MAGEEEEITDVSGFILDSEQDAGDRQYRIVLHCMDEYRVDRGAEVLCKISGSSSRRLTVIIDNKRYYMKKLPGSATECKAHIKHGRKEDLVVLTIAKRETGKWKE